MMKKIKTSILLVCLLLMASPLKSIADTQWDSPAAPVDVKKVWSITLSDDIEGSTVNDKTIYVFDENDELQSTQAVWLKTKPREIKVQPPVGGYIEGQNYVLHISSSLKSSNHLTLIDDVRMDFTIQESSVQKTVLGTWKTSYKGLNLIATFNEDYTSLVKLGEIEERGLYKIEGEDMTMTVLGETRTGRIEKMSPNMFTITSPYGNVMKFER